MTRSISTDILGLTHCYLVSLRPLESDVDTKGDDYIIYGARPV